MQGLDIRLKISIKMRSTTLQTVILSIVALFCFHGSKAQPVELKNGYKIDIRTSGICEMCKETLEYDLAFEKGVKEAVFNLDNKVITIIYNPKRTNPDRLRKRITKIGYHADWLARDSAAYHKLPLCCKDGSHGTSIPQVPLRNKGN